jgi:hypothetical protein
MSNLTITGTIHKIGETEQVTERFKKRMVVIQITSGNENQYTETVPFEVVQDKCETLDRFSEGQAVKVSFNLRGREWNGRYFVNLNAWKIEKD